MKFIVLCLSFLFISFSIIAQHYPVSKHIQKYHNSKQQRQNQDAPSINQNTNNQNAIHHSSDYQQQIPDNPHASDSSQLKQSQNISPQQNPQLQKNNNQQANLYHSRSDAPIPENVDVNKSTANYWNKQQSQEKKRADKAESQILQRLDQQ